MRTFSSIIIMLIITTFSVSAEKVLIYDEEKGIIFVDSEEAKKKKSKPKSFPKSTAKKTVTPKKSIPQQQKTIKKKAKTDLHLNRKKDPPELYFKSGLKYYQDGNYSDALKNFKYASNKSLKPQYLLWIGKTYRKLHQYDQMTITMNRIIDDYSESDVADDALFEMAFYHQINNRYSEATEFYKILAERYPFGLSYSNGDEFLEISRKERQRMRGEIMSALPIIGIKAQSLEEGYSEFQKRNGLEVTGKGDSITVTLIRNKFKEKSLNDESISKTRKSLMDNLKWAITAGVIYFFLLIAMIIFFLKLKRFQKELSLMKETLTDMRLVQR